MKEAPPVTRTERLCQFMTLHSKTYMAISSAPLAIHTLSDCTRVTRARRRTAGRAHHRAEALPLPGSVGAGPAASTPDTHRRPGHRDATHRDTQPVRLAH